MHAKFIILFELLNAETISLVLPTRPYQEDDKFMVKINKTFRQMQRQTARSARRKLLMYAFYLGELLDQEQTTALQRTKARKTISKYYFNAALRVYRLYCHDRYQIYRTSLVTLKKISSVSSEEFERILEIKSDQKLISLELATIAQFSQEVQTLQEENCNPD